MSWMLGVRVVLGGNHVARWFGTAFEVLTGTSSLLQRKVRSGAPRGEGVGQMSGAVGSSF